MLSIPILLLMIIWIFLSGGRSAARDREKIKRKALEKIRQNHSVLSEDESVPAAYKPEKKRKKNAQKKNESPSVDDDFIEE